MLVIRGLTLQFPNVSWSAKVYIKCFPSSFYDEKTITSKETTKHKIEMIENTELFNSQDLIVNSPLNCDAFHQKLFMRICC